MQTSSPPVRSPRDAGHAPDLLLGVLLIGTARRLACPVRASTVFVETLTHQAGDAPDLLMDDPTWAVYEGIPVEER